jgi:hypothetical protein
MEQRKTQNLKISIQKMINADLVYQLAKMFMLTMGE